MGMLLCEQNFRDVWIRNESVRAEIGQILHTDTHPHTHTHTTAAKLVVRIAAWLECFSEKPSYYYYYYLNNCAAPCNNPLSPFLTNSRFYFFLIPRCRLYLPISSPDWSCGPKSCYSCFAHGSGRPFQCKLKTLTAFFSLIKKNGLRGLLH